MTIASGETKVFATKYGSVTVTNVGDIQLNFVWANGKERGFLNPNTGDCTVPQNVLNAVLSQI